MASGPGGAEELEPDLGHPEPGPQVAGEAERLDEVVDVEREREPIAASRTLVAVRPSLRSSCAAPIDVRDGTDAVRAGTTSRSSSSTRSRSPRVGERRRADLDGGRAGEQQLDRVVAAWPRRRRRRSAGRGARRARRGRPARRPGGWPGPTARRRRRRAPGGRCSASMTMPSRVLTSVTASAPASRAAAAIATRSVDVRAELGPPRPPAGRRWPPIAVARWPSASGRRCARRPSRFGQRQVDLDRDDLAAARRPAARPPAGSRRPMRPQMLATTRGAGAPSSGGRSSRQPGGDARALQADGVEHPGRSSRAGAAPGCPAHGVGRQRLHHDRAERRQVEVAAPARRRGPPCPTRSSPGWAASTDPIRRASRSPAAHPSGQRALELVAACPAWYSCRVRTARSVAAQSAMPVGRGERRPRPW